MKTSIWELLFFVVFWGVGFSCLNSFWAPGFLTRIFSFFWAPGFQICIKLVLFSGGNKFQSSVEFLRERGIPGRRLGGIWGHLGSVLQPQELPKPKSMVLLGKHSKSEIRQPPLRENPEPTLPQILPLF